MSASNEAHGLVLSSGGAEGAYAVGVVKALLNGKAPNTNGQPIDPQVVSGTSIGTVSAALLLSYDGDMKGAADNLERIWRDELSGDNFGLSNGAFRFRGNPIDYFSPRRFMRSPLEGFEMGLEDGTSLARDFAGRGARFMRSSDAIPQRLMKLFSLSAFVSTSPLGEVITRNVSYSRLRKSKRVLAINTTDASHGKLKTFYNQDLTDEQALQIILASAAIPGFLPPIKIGSEIYLDGAVLAYTKLSPAINAGARILHLVHVDPDAEDSAISEPEATLDTLYRNYGITWVARVKRGMKDSKRINEAVKFLKRFVREQNLSPEAAQELYKAMLPEGSFETPDHEDEPTRIAVHRYFPHGGDNNLLGMLNLGRKRIEGLIEKGYNDTLAHDCKRNNCILPS